MICTVKKQAIAKLNSSQPQLEKSVLKKVENPCADLNQEHQIVKFKFESSDKITQKMRLKFCYKFALELAIKQLSSVLQSHSNIKSEKDELEKSVIENSKTNRFLISDKDIKRIRINNLIFKFLFLKLVNCWNWN